MGLSNRLAVLPGPDAQVPGTFYLYVQMPPAGHLIDLGDRAIIVIAIGCNYKGINHYGL